MLTETMKIALTLTSMMIAGLSFMAFGYSMKQFIRYDDNELPYAIPNELLPSKKRR